MRFSVIIPLYNKGPYVEKTLRSIFDQSYSDYELIIVNDGSQDNSLILAKQVLEGRKAIIINQENLGVSTARNNGVAASHGDYICFLDADDWWEPAFLERMDRFIEEYSEAGIYGTNYYYVKNNRKTVGVNATTGYINYCKKYSECLHMPLTSISVAIPRSVFNDFGGFKSNLKLGEDFDLWIRIALKHKVAFLNEPLANYNQDVDVASRGTRRLQKPENHMLWNLDYLSEEEKTNPDYKQLVDNLRINSLFPYFISKEYHDSAIGQLNKVDWNLQKRKYKKLYKRPLCYLRFRDRFMKTGSQIKQLLLRKI